MPINPQELETALNNLLGLKVNDPTFSTVFEQLRRRSSGIFHDGTVVDSVPHAGIYLVTVTTGMSIQATLLSQSSGMSPMFGNVDASSLIPGTRVLLYSPINDIMSYIIGAMPQIIETGNRVLPDCIVQAPLTGIADDAIYQDVLGKDRSWGIQNLSSSRPTDQVAGEWGQINEFGLAFMLSKFMALMRVSDNCGIWAFYFDKLLRLHGYNLELFTSSTERRVFNDEGEVHDVLFGTKYPWEALGLFKYGSEAFREANGEWKQDNQDSYYEPKSADQTGLWRYTRMRGYLGDLEREMIALPPELEAPEVYSSSDTPYKGLFESTKGSDGRYGMRSAKEIVFVKYALIPVPKQLAPPDDSTNGDTHGGYKASGILGDDGTPAPKPQTEFEWGTELGDARSGLFLEYLAYTFNWYKEQGIANHLKDWKLPEESEITLGTGDETVSGALYESDGTGLEGLQSSYWADLPKFAKLKIDHRTEAVKYYQSMSCVAMLDDGSVLIEDGYGSQLVMSRGNVKITAPGDVMLAPGRNVVTWAPGDFIARAGRSVDITATKHDVRIKAERNMHILGGNTSETPGGILLESRAKAREFVFDNVGEEVISSGIVLKTSADVTIWAGKDLHLGVRQVEGSTPGRVVIDANDGAADVYMKAANITRDIVTSAVDNFDDKASVFTKAGCNYGVPVNVRGSVVVVSDPDTGQPGDVIAEGSVAAVGSLLTGSGIPGIIPDSHTRGWEGALLEHSGVVISSDEDNSMMLVGRTPDFFKDTISSTGDEITSRIDTAVAGIDEVNKEIYTEDDGLGNSTLINKVGFSLRSDEQYEVGTGFKIHQTRWQQLYRKLGITLVWAETAVSAPGGGIETYPHPGKKAWVDDTNLLVDKDQYFDTAANKAAARVSYIPGAAPVAPDELSLQSGYLVTREID